MKALFRILGTAAAVAVTGAAIVVLDKILNDKAPLHVEEIEFPEDAENDAEEAAKTAQAYAEGETKAEGEAKVESEAKAETPNPNPVEVGPAVAPKDENGKFDPHQDRGSFRLRRLGRAGLQGLICIFESVT